MNWYPTRKRFLLLLILYSIQSSPYAAEPSKNFCAICHDTTKVLSDVYKELCNECLNPKENTANLPDPEPEEEDPGSETQEEPFLDEQELKQQKCECKSKCRNRDEFLMNEIDKSLCQSCVANKWLEDDPDTTQGPLRYLVWLYGILSVVLIAFAGFLSVIFIPRLPTRVFNITIQFLIALAVGTLMGDALLHLIPHGFMGHNHSHGHAGEKKDECEEFEGHGHSHDHGHSHGSQGHDDHDDHNAMVWKGMVALSVFFFLFIIERIMNIISSSGAADPKSSVSKTVNKDTHSGDISPMKPSKSNGESITSSIEKHKESGYDTEGHGLLSGKEMESNVCNRPKEDSSIFVTEHVTSHHGHSHSHRHFYALKGGISSLAILLVAGDSFHKFADGLAIGASFGVSTTDGITTSLAVLFHEVPHELGDFGVLLRSGLTVKRAIIGNFIASSFSLIGVLVGLGIGSIESANEWVFAGTAGMFIYIALVDIVPELAVGLSEDISQWGRLALQGAGLILGFVTMLLIALYEHDFGNLL